MILDIADSVLKVSIALAEIVDQQMLDQRLRIAVKVLREVQLALENVLVNDQGIIVGEGIDSSNHLIDEDS